MLAYQRYYAFSSFQEKLLQLFYNNRLKFLEAFEFNTQALLKNGDKRGFDTEMKFIFDFLENHYTKGNHFKIQISSVLYPCQNCQLYLEAFLDYIKQEGKTLEIELRTHSDVRSIGSVKNIK